MKANPSGRSADVTANPVRLDFLIGCFGANPLARIDTRGSWFQSDLPGEEEMVVVEGNVGTDAVSAAILSDQS